MEIGSGGGGGGSSGGSGDDQLHGLKFGKKIYFEDATGGAAPASDSSSMSAPSPSPPPSSSSKAAGGSGGGKKGKAVAGAGPAAASAPPRCQVEGCNVDLSGSKGYYCRHKVCAMHSKTPRVVVAGIEQRFCQQCSRFHQLPEFDQGKRSCRRRLAGHNERRRRPPPGPLASRFGRLGGSFEEPGRLRSYLLDFSYPRVPSSVRDAWPAVRPGDRVSMPGSIQWQGSLDPRPPHVAAAGYGAHAYSTHHGCSGSGPPVFPDPELPPGGCLTGVGTDSSCALSLLSTQPWDTSATHGASHSHRSAAMAAAAGFDGNPVAVSPSVMVNSYMVPASPWTGSRSHEGARSVPHQLPHDVPLDVTQRPGSSQHGDFSGELELALQGNRHPGRHADHGATGSGTFDHTGGSTNWPL